ncbi:hypothetical protein B0H16DRAFT_1607383 [Mycena metata]|uniref:Secreted protein n=1 Tax=Mycena metata TaxID=1033252 RepID=A0AAD7MIK3_9AGAR|nr:hypothetical protein B0H16DRAFT_1607383 [Mycena metata]
MLLVYLLIVCTCYLTTYLPGAKSTRARNTCPSASFSSVRLMRTCASRHLYIWAPNMRDVEIADTESRRALPGFRASRFTVIFSNG